MTKITAYKGFNADLTCRDYQFEIGKTYQHEGEVEVCGSGFHACEYPLDVFASYEPASSRFAEVEVSGDIAYSARGGELVSSAITIKTELSFHQMVEHAVEWIASKIDKSAGQVTIEGDRSAAIHTRYRSVATNTSNQSAATNTGDRSIATNNGAGSVATNTGDGSAAINTGCGSVATNTGYGSVATNTGHQSVATNTAARSVVANAGDWSAANNTGRRSVATNAGDKSTATNIGYRSAADVSGFGSIAASLGVGGKAKAIVTSAIVLCYRSSEGDIIHIRASKVGDNGVKPDTWYVLNASGEFEEADN
ncbi:hypothetical protein AAH678_15345 [Sodalis endosymbiont of Spalangia cameroni]|uniref:DUF7666 domain-containing protein n=1 Tax=Sodalis praecaptivus TaxID=1239307 RepID=UPI0031F85DD1